jgi:hypothetical protein
MLEEVSHNKHLGSAEHSLIARYRSQSIGFT